MFRNLSDNVQTNVRRLRSSLSELQHTDVLETNVLDVFYSFFLLSLKETQLEIFTINMLCTVFFVYFCAKLYYYNIKLLYYIIII